MQQRGVGRALIEGDEGHVGDACEALERPTDLSARVEAERTWTHLVDHHAQRRGCGDPTQLGMVAQQAADAERVGCAPRDDLIGLAQRGGRRGMTTGPPMGAPPSFEGWTCRPPPGGRIRT